MILRRDEMQLARGESLRDTALVLSRHVDAVGVRTGPQETVEELARHGTIPVFNMLTAEHHPCQALADLLTLREDVRRARGPAARLRRRRQQRRALAGDRSARSPASRSSSPRRRATSSSRAPARRSCATRREAVAGAHAVYTDVWVSMGDEETAAARRAALARLPRRRRAARPRAPGRDRAARPSRARRRGDHRRGPLRRAPADLGPGREPPPRAEGAARVAAGRALSSPAAAAVGRRRARAARSTRSPSAAPASRAPTAATSCSSTAAFPGDLVRARVARAQARLRRRARASRCSSRAPTGSRRSPTIPARPGRCCATSASSRSSSEQVDDALRRIGQLDGFELEPIVPARRAVALPQQARVLVRRGRGRRAGLRLPRARLVGADRAARGLPARVRARQRGPPRGARRGAAPQGLEPLDRRTREGFLRNLVVREGRAHRRDPGPARHRRGRRSTATRSRRAVDGRRPALDADRRRSPRPPPAATTELLAGVGAAGRAARRARARALAARPSSRPTPRWPSASTRSSSSDAELHGWERVFDLYCGIGTIGLSLARRAGTVHGLEIVEDAVADAIAQRARATRSPTPPSSPATCAWCCASSSSAPGRPDLRRRRPAARRPLAEDRAARSSRRRRERIVYVSCNPTTLAPERRAARRGGLAARARDARSTCSRRPRTSSASRCSTR